MLPHLTIAENIAVVPRLLGHPAAQLAARTEALLKRLHLPPERYATAPLVQVAPRHWVAAA